MDIYSQVGIVLLLMYWQLKRSTREKEDFLDYIGTRKFDKNEFSKVYFEQKAKNLFVIFIVFIAAISLLKIIKIPFVNTLIMSQTIFFDMLFTKLGVSGILKNIFSSIVSFSLMHQKPQGACGFRF